MKGLLHESDGDWVVGAQQVRHGGGALVDRGGRVGSRGFPGASVVPSRSSLWHVCRPPADPTDTLSLRTDCLVCYS